LSLPVMIFLLTNARRSSGYSTLWRTGRWRKKDSNRIEKSQVTCIVTPVFYGRQEQMAGSAL
jgi:hypothetical protein